MKPYTVKVPPQWAGINSERAQAWLRDYFIHPLALPADPGAGERVLRLTLDERLVDALAGGSGDRPAVAMRRLLAARARELPARKEQRALLPAKGKALAQSLGGPPADWLPGDAPAYRAESWARMQAARALWSGQSAPLVSQAPPKPHLSPGLAAFLWLVLPILILVLPAVFRDLFHRGGGLAAAQPARFGAWVPE